MTPSKSHLQRISAIVFDCDGVLTPGDLFFDANGPCFLRFNAKDGYGVGLAARRGIKIGVLSGRPTDIVEKRYRELGVQVFVGSCRDKKAGMLEVCRALGVEPSATAYVGDDLPDLGAFAVAGLKVAVADAVLEVRQAADWVTVAAGGCGAAREVCDAVVRAITEAPDMQR